MARARKQSTRRAGSKGAKQPIDRLRTIIGAWPETDERLSHGSPTWWGGKKTFATFAENHHGDGRVAVWIKSDPDTQEGLVEANPEIFFIPPYVGPRGWIGVDLAAGADWDVVAGLLEDGYRSVAPRRALAALDAANKV